MLLNVDRDELKRRLKVPLKLPRELELEYTPVELPHRWYDVERWRWVYSSMGTYPVKVVRGAPLGSRKSSKHRVIVMCRCGREVPAGRMHQHRC